ncbi:MAG: argininosuccinate lyase [Nitrososphaerota archaeon]|nr:argininosuccinate lyase [Candidatus Bathyarchaeota archaeon]MDW8022324.1 argininosuccinate lyase [Nitrososphaerota archaeon]
MSKLLRGGRLAQVKDDVVKFISSIQSDQRLLKAVIKINQTHVIMLLKQKIIKQTEGAKLLKALNELGPEIKLPPSLEDVHMFIEEKIIKACGQEVGGNLHIAKSRNDQVATAIRMELRENLLKLMESLITLQETLIKLAESHMKTVFPGYTHTQPAQPVTFAHYLLSYTDCLGRDFQRLENTYERVNLCPMGAGALATSSFPIDREGIAELLGFDGVLENSIDAVGSRDFILETLASLTILAVNISRFVEDLILWSSEDIGLIDLPEDFCSTSSIMPQKKNPDVLEVIRARMSHILGNFVTSVTTLKAVPSGYNLDFQEITPRLWESLDVAESCLDMLSKLVPSVKVHNKTLTKPQYSFLAATELANLLVRKYEVPFRSAHKIIGSVVKILISQGLTLNNLTAEAINKTAYSLGYSVAVKDEDLREALDLMKIVESHNVIGGPSPNEVRRMLIVRKEKISLAKSKIANRKLQLRNADEKIRAIINSYLSSSESE